MSDHFPDDLETLLRGDRDPLAAPAELWDTIRGRARRRKMMKGALAGAAVAVVLAGAVPAVIAVRNNSAGNGSTNVASSPDKEQPGLPTATSVARPTALSALSPQTVSFVTQKRGWVSGPLDVDGGQVSGGLGMTTDGGASWAPLQSAPKGLVRMATGEDDLNQPAEGFSFGTSYQVTHDGGQTWQDLPSPGYIEDLEITPATTAAPAVVWALVKDCVSCSGPRLFTATLDQPQLTRVDEVPEVGGFDSALTVDKDSVFVTGANTFWFSNDRGTTWQQGDNPCDGEAQSFAVWGPTNGIFAACSPARGPGSLFLSHNDGAKWTNIANLPAGVTVGPAALSAGTHNNLMITTGTGPAWVTTTAGTRGISGTAQRWTRADPDTGPVTFAAYIDDGHIVGLRGGDDPAFISSTDAGRSWTVTPFGG